MDVQVVSVLLLAIFSLICGQENVQENTVTPLSPVPETTVSAENVRVFGIGASLSLRGPVSRRGRPCIAIPPGPPETLPQV